MWLFADTQRMGYLFCSARFSLTLLFIMAAFFILGYAPAAAADCTKASMYFHLADIAMSDARAYEQKGKDDLAKSARESAFHFAHQANQYFSGSECGVRTEERGKKYYDLRESFRTRPHSHAKQKVCERDVFAVLIATPEYPEKARAANLGPVSVLVRVTVGPRNNLLDAQVVQSSGHTIIDEAALTAAHKSRFGSAIHMCKRQKGTYNIRFDFDHT